MLYRDEKKDDLYKLKPIRICTSEDNLPFEPKSIDLFIRYAFFF